MVMEASGSSERKYCHCSGGGQRLIRTSLRLMERSTERFTTTGTNSEPPCCVCVIYMAVMSVAGSQDSWGPKGHYHISTPGSPGSDVLPMPEPKWPLRTTQSPQEAV